MPTTAVPIPMANLQPPPAAHLPPETISTSDSLPPPNNSDPINVDFEIIDDVSSYHTAPNGRAVNVLRGRAVNRLRAMAARVDKKTLATITTTVIVAVVTSAIRETRPQRAEPGPEKEA